MNILHISAVKTWGGGENHIFSLVKELEKASPAFKNVILCPKNSALHEKLIATEIPVEVSALDVKIDPRFSFKIISICKKYEIDLIHIHDPTALTLAIIADKLYNLPPFIFSKKTSFSIKNRKQTLYKYNYAKIKKILCVSEETRQVTSNSIREKDKLVTIYHGTNINSPVITKNIDLRSDLNLKPEKILVGNIANHIRAKDLDTYLNVIDYLVNSLKIKRFHFIQIGEPTERTAALLEKVRALNLEDHVSFMEFIPNASSLISQFDISLMTSQSEGIPQFIYESFLYKVPVVSTNVGGIPEIIKDGENGFLAPAHDHIKLGNLLVTLSDDVSLQEKFIHRSYAQLLRSFTSQKMAERTSEIYKEVLYG